MTLKQRVGRRVFRHLPTTRFLFDQLRAEAAAQSITALNRISPARRRRLAAVRAASDLLVNVGCGPHVLDRFVNLDVGAADPRVIEWDCRRTLPVHDGGAAGIRAEQFVEHLETREELPAFLRDCLRALKPGGVLRVIVPDAARFLQAYCTGTLDGFRALAVPDPFPADLPTRMDVVNHVFHQWHEHRWGYDFETLAHRLRTAGFAQVEPAAFRRSVLPALANDRDVHAAYSLYVDAVKGSACVES
jgi:predicted SAM-dependent methyltransferase